MAQVLSWVALGLGALAAAHGLGRAARVKSPLPPALRPLLLAVGGMVLLAVLLTLPSGAPWSPGQTLAPGLVLGAAAVMLGALAGGRSLGTAAGAPAAAVSVLLLLFPGRLLDALGGFGIGAVAAGVLLASGVRRTRGEDDDRAWGAEVAALAAVTLAAATALAAYHRGPTGVREWQPLPALLGAVLAAGLAARGFLPGRSQGSLPGIAVGVLPLLVIGAVAAYRLNGTPPLLWALLTGLAVFAFIAGAAGMDTGKLRLRADLGLLAALLALGGAALAFRELRGYGVGLAALSGVAVLAVFGEERGRVRDVVRGAVTLLVLVTLYRVFAERYDYRRTLEPDFLYYYVALAVGALLPALLAGSAARRAFAGAGAAVSWLTLAGLAAVAAPLVLWVLLGERAQAAMLVGLPVGVGFALSGWGADRNPEGADGVPSGEAGAGSLAGLLALGTALSAVQLTHLLAPLAMRTRWERVGMLAAVGIVLVVWMVVSSVMERKAGVTDE